MGRWNLRQKIIESPEKWRKRNLNLAINPSENQKKLKRRRAWGAVNRRPLRTETKFLRLRYLAFLQGQ